jgi:hypothetical protein
LPHRESDERGKFFVPVLPHLFSDVRTVFEGQADGGVRLGGGHGLQDTRVHAGNNANGMIVCAEWQVVLLAPSRRSPYALAMRLSRRQTRDLTTLSAIVFSATGLAFLLVLPLY